MQLLFSTTQLNVNAISDRLLDYRLLASGSRRPGFFCLNTSLVSFQEPLDIMGSSSPQSIVSYLTTMSHQYIVNYMLNEWGARLLKPQRLMRIDVDEDEKRVLDGWRLFDWVFAAR